MYQGMEHLSYEYTSLTEHGFCTSLTEHEVYTSLTEQEVCTSLKEHGVCTSPTGGRDLHQSGVFVLYLWTFGGWMSSLQDEEKHIFIRYMCIVGETEGFN